MKTIDITLHERTRREDGKYHYKYRDEIKVVDHPFVQFKAPGLSQALEILDPNDLEDIKVTDTHREDSARERAIKYIDDYATNIPNYIDQETGCQFRFKFKDPKIEVHYDNPIKL